MRKDDKGPKVRITDQFHDQRAMVYDLKCDAIRISISIAGSDGRPRGGAESGRSASRAHRIVVFPGRSGGLSTARLGSDPPSPGNGTRYLSSGAWKAGKSGARPENDRVFNDTLREFGADRPADRGRCCHF
jgi:hypothetical protein